VFIRYSKITEAEYAEIIKKWRLIKMKIDWKRKLTSRKLWVAVAGFVSGCILTFGGSAEIAEKVIGVMMQGASVVGYILGEGLADSANGGGNGGS
jgi:hypothetical protein